MRLPVPVFSLTLWLWPSKLDAERRVLTFGRLQQFPKPLFFVLGAQRQPLHWGQWRSVHEL